MAEINEGKSSKKAKKVSLTALRSMLKKGVVKFEYKKKDGTIRKAEGTLRKSLIPEIDKDGGGLKAIFRRTASVTMTWKKMTGECSFVITS